MVIEIIGLFPISRSAKRIYVERGFFIGVRPGFLSFIRGIFFALLNQYKAFPWSASSKTFVIP